jgi:hypothetical protein
LRLATFLPAPPARILCAGAALAHAGRAVNRDGRYTSAFPLLIST